MTWLCTSVKDDVCKKYKEKLFQSCENRNKKLHSGLASLLGSFQTQIYLLQFFSFPKKYILKSQRKSKYQAWLYQISNIRLIGGKKPCMRFMRALRRTSVQSDTKEHAEGQAALERVEVAMGERWTDVKKIKQKLTIVNGNILGKRTTNVMPWGLIWGLILPP